VDDGELLLQAIQADPGDDLVRFVYADWLEEAGQAEWAELIRVQLALATAPTNALRATEQRLLGVAGERLWQRRREWALPEHIRRHWPADVGGWEWYRGFPEVWHCPAALWEKCGPEVVASAPVRRVVLIDREPYPEGPSRTWYRDDGQWTQRPAEACLPAALFDLLEPADLDLAMFDHARTYPDRAAAMAALSDACIALAAQTV
jgi:uncharacterized protein (TIGR02996 family)